MKLLLALALALAGAPAPAGSPDAATILQRSENAWHGLNTYQVPVTISGSVRVAIISLPVHMSGTQYYQAPDQQALHINNPPRLASGLGNTLSTMGTPQTWLNDYTIAAPATFEHHHGISQYHLPRSAKVSATFPSYSGYATIVYGDYQLNQPISPSVFQNGSR